MIFVVTLIALLIERFFDWSHLRYWNWYMIYQRMVLQTLSKKSPYIVLACTVISLMLVTLLFEYIVSGWLYGFVKFLFEVFVLLYCLGPQDLWADAFSCINATTQSDNRFAADQLRASFGVPETKDLQSLHKQFVASLFVEANRRVFSVIFWFIILGPMGALLYRCISLTANSAAQYNIIPELSRSAAKIEAILDWISVRIFTSIFALGGQFVQVSTCWGKKVMLGLSGNATVLKDCGMAALGYDTKDKVPENGSAERAAISLIDRSFVIVLVIIGIIALLML